MTIHPQEHRAALRRIESMDPQVSMICPGCKSPVRIPANASYSVCPCGKVLKEPK